MRDARFAIGRFVVFALVLLHWVGTSPSSLTRDFVGSPSLDRLDTQSAILSHRAPAVACIKQSLIDRLPHAAADDATTTVSAADVIDAGHDLNAGSMLDRPVPAVLPAYYARGPPVA